jgi:hypothetical protein
MNYTHLTEKDFAGLRAERITVLEGEHYRATLRLRECTGVAELEAIGAQLEEIERRIAVHGDGMPATEVDPVNEAAGAP